MSFGSFVLRTIFPASAGLILGLVKIINPIGFQQIADMLIFWEKNADFRGYEFIIFSVMTVWIIAFIAERSIRSSAVEDFIDDL